MLNRLEMLLNGELSDVDLKNISMKREKIMMIVGHGVQNVGIADDYKSVVGKTF